jgi:hypothetical protein
MGCLCKQLPWDWKLPIRTWRDGHVVSASPGRYRASSTPTDQGKLQQMRDVTPDQRVGFGGYVVAGSVIFLAGAAWNIHGSCPVHEEPVDFRQCVSAVSGRPAMDLSASGRHPAQRAGVSSQQPSA